MSLTAGTVVGGDFEVLEPLSEGGMGAVFVALQKSVGRRRALKVMHRELLSDAKLRDRFVQEAKIGASIDSEHVVEVIAAGIDDALKMPWLAMELLEGKDLATLIENVGPLPVADVREVIDQLCHALGAAHEKGVVHRDLKPENVFVARTRRKGSAVVVKVLDFGIAKVLAEARATSAATAALGTPTFMAPEQTEARSKVTPAADVWALGLIVFRALTGKHYWNAANEDGASITALMRELVIDPIVPASERARALGVEGALPEGFDAWFASCVARKPEDRLRDAGAAQRALGEVRGFDSAGALTLHTKLGPERASIADAPKPAPTVLAAPLGDGEPSMATVAAAPLPDAKPSNATVAAEPLREEKDVDADANATIVGAPISERVKTVLGAPLATEPIQARVAERPSQGSRSKLGLVLGGVAVAGAGLAVFALSGGDDDVPTPAPSSVSSQDRQPSTSNGWVQITPPSPAIVLGVPDAAPAARRGLRAARRVMSPREPYAIQAREVSWGELDPFLGTSPKLSFVRPASVPADASSRAELPAIGVPWEVAEAYCKSIGGALPDEAQWEFAARGKDLRSRSWGSGGDVKSVRAFLGREGTVAPVASTALDVTPEGVHDLTGNAREWTSAVWSPDDAFAAAPWATDGEATARVVRGWPLRADAPTDTAALDVAYRDWVCATGGCSPLHPDLPVRPPLAPIGVVIESATMSLSAPKSLRSWVASEAFSELFRGCVSVPLDPSARLTLRAEGKGCAHLGLAPVRATRDVVFASVDGGSVDDASAYRFAQAGPLIQDRDFDGLRDSVDKCPDDPEDFDGFQDADGCPDFDNDGDGISDARDKCPNEAETKNGFNDDDGCPDQKIAELLSKPTATTPPPAPAPTITAPAPTATSTTCKPSPPALASKELAPAVLRCLEAGLPRSYDAAVAWSEDLVFTLKTSKVPPALTEIGFRCVKPR